MDELIIKIKNTVTALLHYDMDVYYVSTQELVDMMILVFPAIIDCYNSPKLSDLREDATYWPGQLERVIKALHGVDHFEVVDVLYNETYANLVELRDILMQRGIM